MKKLLLPLCVSAFTLVVQASTTNVGETVNISTASGLQVINFNGGETTNENGNKTSYVSYSAESGSGDRYTNAPWNVEINVASGVDAVMNFSGSQIDGFKDEKYAVSPNSHRYHIGGSNYSADSPNANVEVKGASATTSSLAFYGSNFETGGATASQTNKEKSAADDNIIIRDITFSFKGTGKFGTNIVTLQNSVFNLDSGTLFSGTKLIKPEGAETTQSTPIVAETIIDNSTYNINTTTSSNVGDLGALTFMNGSALNVKQGTVNATTISVMDIASSINVKNGATLVLTGANALNKTNVGNINIETGGTLKASSTNIALVDGEDFTLSGGKYELGTFTGSSGGKSNIYVVADSLKITDAGGITSLRTFFIGVDTDGVTHKTDYKSINGFQLNGGGKIVLRGGSSLSGDGVNFADTTAYNKDAAWGNSNYIEAGTTITANHSRMNGGFFDGTITINKGYQDNSNWDYTFALGIVSQKANVILGENVDITVYGSTGNTSNAGEVITKNLQGKLFSMVGNITVNAGLGKIKADDAAGMIIRKADDGSRSVLTLNTTDAFAIGYSDATNKVFNTQAQSRFMLEAGATAKFVINDNNNIGKITFEDNTSNLILDVAQGKTLTIGTFENLASATDKITVGLDSEVLFGELLVKMEQDVILDKINFYEVGADGNLTTTQRTLEAGNLFIEKFDNGVYSVYTQAVPEPAQWAVILGAIALAFVAYRRRR